MITRHSPCTAQVNALTEERGAWQQERHELHSRTEEILVNAHKASRSPPMKESDALAQQENRELQQQNIDLQQQNLQLVDACVHGVEDMAQAKQACLQPLPHATSPHTSLHATLLHATSPTLCVPAPPAPPTRARRHCSPSRCARAC